MKASGEKSAKHCRVGMDLGGTNLRAAFVDDAGLIVTARQEKLPAKKTPEEILKLMCRMIGDMQKANGHDLKLKGIGVGAPGGIDVEAGLVTQSPHLPLWKDVALRSLLAESTGLPVYVDNDANCFAKGEFHLGVAKGQKNLLGITLGTGIGGGLILDGKVWHGATGMAGEVGHMVIDINGHDCACGGKGCLETYASGTALVQRVIEGIAQGKTSSLSKLAVIRGEDIEVAALKGDELAREAFRLLGQALGTGIANIVNLTGIRFIVIGGKVTRGWDFFYDALMGAVDRQCFRRAREGLEVKKAGLEDQAGLLGASQLVP